MVDNDFDSRLEKSYEDEKIIDEIQSWEDLSELERRIIRQVGTYLSTYIFNFRPTMILPYVQTRT